MNYIAHLHLTYPNQQLSVGNLIGDMVKPSDVKDLPEEFRKGVLAHRRIDSFSDQHPSYKAIVRELRPVHGKYSPVVLDIVFDHVLCKHWKSVANGPKLPDFFDWAQGVMDLGIPNVPDYVAKRLKRMSQHRWLHGYTNRIEMRAILRGMDYRAQFPSRFHRALVDVDRLEPLMIDSLADILKDTSMHLKLFDAV